MLNFYDSRIKFNFEVGLSEKYTITASEFIDIVHLSEIFPNCTPTNYLTTTYMKANPGNYCLSYNQFRNFVKDWRGKTSCNKLIEDNWFSSYVDCLLFYGRNFGEHTRDSLINPLACYDMLRNEGRGSQNSSAKIEWNLNCPPLPEISWAVEDCLHALCYGRVSPYENQVNSFINSNLERMRFQTSINNGLGYNVVNYGLDLSVEPDIRKLDLFQPNSLFYFNPVLCEERVRTNFIHIANCLKKYWEIKGRYDLKCLI